MAQRIYLLIENERKECLLIFIRCDVFMISKIYGVRDISVDDICSRYFICVTFDQLEKKNEENKAFFL